MCFGESGYCGIVRISTKKEKQLMKMNQLLRIAKSAPGKPLEQILNAPGFLRPKLSFQFVELVEQTRSPHALRINLAAIHPSSTSTDKIIQL